MAKYSLHQSKEPLTFDEAVEHFLTHRRIEGLAESSLRFYKDTFRYISTHGFPTDIANCTTAQVELFISKLLQNGMKPVTLNGYAKRIICSPLKFCI